MTLTPDPTKLRVSHVSRLPYYAMTTDPEDRQTPGPQQLASSLEANVNTPLPDLKTFERAILSPHRLFSI